MAGGASGSAPGLHEAREPIALGPLHRVSRRQIGVRACLSLQGGQCDIGLECDQLRCRQLRQTLLTRVALRPLRAVQQVRDGGPTDVFVGCQAHTCLERLAPSGSYLIGQGCSLCLPALAAIMAGLSGVVPGKIHTPGADRVASCTESARSSTARRRFNPYRR